MTDAELSLALARKMGVKGKIHEVGSGAGWTDDAGDWHMFDPIHSGADFDAVLMWAYKAEMRVRFAVAHVFEDRFTGAPLFPEDYAEFRRAVCEAIVGAT